MPSRAGKVAGKTGSRTRFCRRSGDPQPRGPPPTSPGRSGPARRRGPSSPWPALLKSRARFRAKRSAQEADHVVEDLVFVDLVEDLVLRAQVDVLFEVAAPQVLHRLRSRVERRQDVAFGVD